MNPEERRARNESAFREANEGIRRRLDELPNADALLPFICECDQPECTEVLQLPASEYDWVRESGARFLVALGHEGGQATILAERDGYMVVKKEGVEGAVAEQHNPRSEA